MFPTSNPYSSLMLAHAAFLSAMTGPGSTGGQQEQNQAQEQNQGQPRLGRRARRTARREAEQENPGGEGGDRGSRRRVTLEPGPGRGSRDQHLEPASYRGYIYKQSQKAHGTMYLWCPSLKSEYGRDPKIHLEDAERLDLQVNDEVLFSVSEPPQARPFAPRATVHKRLG